MIAMLKGAKRYILMPPNQCKNIYLLPKSHPSGRHSQVDWSDPDFEKHPNFRHARATETILRQGQVLYVPSHWIHYIQVRRVIDTGVRKGRALFDLRSRFPASTEPGHERAMQLPVGHAAQADSCGKQMWLLLESRLEVLGEQEGPG